MLLTGIVGVGDGVTAGKPCVLVGVTVGVCVGSGESPGVLGSTSKAGVRS